jgi:hypothetical protein
MAFKLRNMGGARPVISGEAEALLEREEADGLPEAAEGDMEGTEIGGCMVEAVQAD